MKDRKAKVFLKIVHLRNVEDRCKVITSVRGEIFGEENLRFGFIYFWPEKALKESRVFLIAS